MNSGIVKSMVDALPPDLDRAVLRILSFHIGRENAISRVNFMAALKMHGFALNDDRTMRLQINLLRKRGFMICSAGGTNGGYWMAQNWAELEEYLASEVHPRAMDLLEIEKALRKAGEWEWGALANQFSLFR